MLNATHYRDDKGRAVISKKKAHALIGTLFVLVSLFGYNLVQARGILALVNATQEAQGVQEAQGTLEPIYLRIGEPVAWEPMDADETVRARVSWYSVADSCHYPAKGGGCYSANYPHKIQAGDVACPKKYKFGTKVIIEGVTYTCNDRTADWVQRKWVEGTFDIFVPASEQVQGARFINVTIKK